MQSEGLGDPHNHGGRQGCWGGAQTREEGGTYEEGNRAQSHAYDWSQNLDTIHDMKALSDTYGHPTEHEFKPAAKIKERCVYFVSIFAL